METGNPNMARNEGAGAQGNIQGNIDEASILELQEFMERGALTSRELVLHYMERIATHDRGGAAINSVLELNPDALAIADALDAERRVTGARGPLHGIPVLLKDNIDTGDHMHTSAGSIALAESYAPEDSAVADRLREAGAVLLGKTNMTEWANFIAEDMPNGYSSRGGQVRNPYGPGQFDVGGSSSGSGAAVASSFAVVAIGTETSGSILSPASANSVVGIKPTVGLISRHGIIPISHSQDTAGPMAKSVADAAILLGVLTGVDVRDPVTRASVSGVCRNYRQFLDPDGLVGARLGVLRPRYFEKLDSDRLAIFERALAAMAGAGAVIVDPVLLPEEDVSGHEVLIHEFKAALNAYLSRLSPRVPVHTLAELIAYNEEHAAVALRHGQALFKRAEEASGTLTEASYIRTRLDDLRRSRERGIDHALAEHHLDALLSPGNFGAALPAKAGYPSICAPGGYTPAGEPFGVTFTGGAYSEPTLIRLAYGFERLTNCRRPPDSVR